jgi:hypothetical protein
MQRRTRYSIYLLVFLAGGLFVYGILSQFYDDNRIVTPAEIHITAQGLTASFEGNEGFADSLYLYKIVAVSGRVRQLIDDGMGNYIARLSGDRSGRSTVDCHLDSLYSRGDLPFRAGDSVTIRGTCAGRWVNVILLQCIIEK